MESAKAYKRILAGLIDLFLLGIFLAFSYIFFYTQEMREISATFIDSFETDSDKFLLIYKFISDMSRLDTFIFFIINLFSYFILQVILPVSTNGKTIGMMFFSISIVKLNETKMSFGTALLRQFIGKLLITTFTLCISSIFNLILLNSKGKRTIPDRISNTLVVNDKR